MRLSSEIDSEKKYPKRNSTIVKYLNDYQRARMKLQKTIPLKLSHNSNAERKGGKSSSSLFSSALS